MNFHSLLCRVAAARGGECAVLLEIDGYPPIPCRDIDQAECIERLWLAFHQPHFPQRARP